MREIYSDHPLGLSVTYLNSQAFKQDLKDAGIDFSTAKIYEMEPDLESSNFGLLRSKGQHVTCPRDQRPGAAYVDSINAEYVGPANVMLSYTWGYAIKDIVDALVAKCQKDERDPATTFVWMCCFCNNQHRIGERSKLSFEEFRQTFYGRMTTIKTVWSLMAPWNEPDYLMRIWCILELYTANTTDGCCCNIIMPPREREAMSKALVVDEDSYDEDLAGFQSLVKVLGDTKIENANASIKQDLDNILQLVRDEIGYTSLNVKVNALLRNWVSDEIKKEDMRMSLACEDVTKDLKYSHFCNKAGGILYNLGNWDGPGGALDYYNKALAIREKVLDKNCPRLAKTYDLIAEKLSINGYFDEALEHYKKALYIREKVMDKNSPTLALYYNNIGLVLKGKGDLDEALEYYNKALDIGKKTLDNNSPDLALYHFNIGSALNNKGDLDGALEYYNIALSIQEKVLNNNDSPTLAKYYNNIGSVLSEMGDLDEALEYCNKALSIQEKVLDKNSPSLATSYVNIGSVLKENGDLDEALEYYHKALAIQEKVMDKSTSPDLSACYNNIGSVLNYKGDLDEALKYFKKSLAIQEKVLYKNSPTLASCYNNIGSVLKSMGDLDGALEYHNKALAIGEKVLDKNSPTLAACYNNIGSVLKGKGDLDGTLEYYNKSLAIVEQVLDENSPTLAICYNNVGLVLQDMNEMERSLEYMGKAVAISEFVFGPNHEVTQDYRDKYEDIFQTLQSR